MNAATPKRHAPTPTATSLPVLVSAPTCCLASTAQMLDLPSSSIDDPSRGGGGGAVGTTGGGAITGPSSSLSFRGVVE